MSSITGIDRESASAPQFAPRPYSLIPLAPLFCFILEIPLGVIWISLISDGIARASDDTTSNVRSSDFSLRVVTAIFLVMAFVGLTTGIYALATSRRYHWIGRIIAVIGISLWAVLILLMLWFWL